MKFSIIQISDYLAKRKSLALVGGVSMFLVYEFNRIYVPEIIQNRFAYRCTHIIENLIAKLARVGSLFSASSEPELLRRILNRLSKYVVPKITLSSKIKILDTFANNVRIKIYSPILNKDELLPAMIFYHGGAYVLFSIDKYEHIMIPLAEELNMVIVAVEYPLAPENKFPIPIEQAYSATSYFLNNLEEYDLNVDINRVILAGDSAGANIATILSSRLRQINENVPKLQALIYPPTQYFTFSLPSAIKYSSLDRIIKRHKAALWHMGMKNVEDYHEDFLMRNYHTLFVEENFRKKFKSYLNINLIPDIYRKDKSYYDNYDKFEKYLYPEKFEENSKLANDKEFESIAKNLMNINFSPGLADDEILKKQPKTFMAVSEFDSRKDEMLIYAQRLSKNGVSVDIAFYENGFHGSFFSNSSVAVLMKKDLVNYIKLNI